MEFFFPKGSFYLHQYGHVQTKSGPPPPQQTQETTIQVNITPEHHTIHLTLKTSATTTTQATLHIQHTHTNTTQTNQTPTQNPDKHIHTTITVYKQNQLSITPTHCLHICLLHPQPTNIPWQQTIQIDPTKTRNRVAAAILLWHINPQLK